MRDPTVRHSDLRLVPPGVAAGTCRLHTATLSLVEGDGTVVELLHVCRVESSAEVVGRISARHGAAIAAAATVRVGVDPLHPVVASLLGTRTAQALEADGDLPGGALRGGADLHIMQRRG